MNQSYKCKLCGETSIAFKWVEPRMKHVLAYHKTTEMGNDFTYFERVD